MSTNLPEVQGAIQGILDRMHNAIVMSMSIAGEALRREAMLNTMKVSNPPKRRVSKKGTPYYQYFPHIGPRSGEGPNRGTGHLAGSFTMNTYYGFGSYIAEVGNSAVYARSLELGMPNSKSGVSFPFLSPAASSMVTTGKLQNIFTRSLNHALGG